MGEAVYYMKIKFSDIGKAEKALPEIQDFFTQGYKAYDYWQTNRNKYCEPERPNSANPNEYRKHADKDFPFWQNFEEKFPMVYEYLGSFNEREDYNNGLSGCMDFGGEEDIDNMEVRKVNGFGYIWYHAMVWHFADWEPLIEFIIYKWGADNADWVSDEHMNPFDTINI